MVCLIAVKAILAECSSEPVPYHKEINKFTGVLVRGCAFNFSKRFSINLHSNSSVFDGSDVPLHIAVRFDKGQIVFNSFSQGHWGEEEYEDISFQKNQTAVFRIVPYAEHFEIAINEKIVKNYTYRQNVSSIKHITVFEDFNTETVYLFYYDRPEIFRSHNNVTNFHKGKSIFVSGIISRKANTFTVNLFCSPSTKSNIAMHFTARFRDNFVVRACRINGKYKHELRAGGMPFSKGAPFKLEIADKGNAYHFFVNNKRFGPAFGKKLACPIKSVKIAGELTFKDFYVQ